MKNILITGGAGFIGLKLATQLLLEQDSQMTVVDNLLSQVHGPNAKCPVELRNGRVKFFQKDLIDQESLSNIVEDANPEIVFHLASETGTGQSYDEIVHYNHVNVLGTAILLDLLRKKAPNLKKVVLASSRAVYGEGAWRNSNFQRVFPKARKAETLKQGQFFPQVETEILTHPLASQETDPTSPASIYASTKLMQEFIVTQSLYGTKAKAIILRLQNVYGPGQSTQNPYTGVLSIFSKQILSGQKLNIYEDGQIVRDFVYVDDVVKVLILAMTRDLPEGIIINIGSGEPTTILLVAQKLMTLYGHPTDSYSISGQFRPGDVRHALADRTLALRTLGWEPSIALQEGLNRLAHMSSQKRSDTNGPAG